MKKIIIVFLLVISNYVFSQDTLFHKSGEIQAVKVAEINPQLIKYRKFENLNGPVYSVNKTDVIRIKYFGGQIDSFNVLATPTVDVVAPIVADEVKPVRNSLTCIGGKIFYNQYQIGEGELLSVINSFPDEAAKKKMKKAHREMNAHRDIGGASLACGLVLGCAVVVATAPFVTGLTTYASLPSDEGMKVAIVGILCGGAMRITGFAVSQSQRNKKKAKAREIVNIYNGDYNFK